MAIQCARVVSFCSLECGRAASVRIFLNLQSHCSRALTLNALMCGVCARCLILVRISRHGIVMVSPSHDCAGDDCAAAVIVAQAGRLGRLDDAGDG